VPSSPSSQKKRHEGKARKAARSTRASQHDRAISEFSGKCRGAARGPRASWHDRAMLKFEKTHEISFFFFFFFLLPPSSSIRPPPLSLSTAVPSLSPSPHNLPPSPLKLAQFLAKIFNLFTPIHSTLPIPPLFISRSSNPISLSLSKTQNLHC